MSLASWKAAFYPESAKAAAKRGEKAAIEHCIRKWEGLTPENLAAHGLKQYGYYIRTPRARSDRAFIVNASTCALCEIHYRESYPCCDPTCPLMIVRGGTPCYERLREEAISPYRAYVATDDVLVGDPQPMLRDLRSALELVQITAHDGGGRP